MMKAVLLTVCIFAIAYYMNEPLPKGWKQPWKTRFLLTFEKLMGVAANVIGKLGFETSTFITACWEVGLDLLQKSSHLEDVVDLQIEEMEGVETYVFKPKGKPQSKLPGMVYFHGGGWVVGNPYIFKNTVRRMVHDTGAVGISVDYRLAPFYPFPAGVEDCVKVTKYFMNNAEKYGVDPSRIFISGDSAGGHLSVVVAMKLREENFPIQPKLLAIFYPAFQGITLQTPSYQANDQDPLVNKDNMAYFYTNHAFGNSKHVESFSRNQHVPKDVMEHLMKAYMPLEALPDDHCKRDYQLVESPSYVEFWDDIKDIIMNPYFSPLIAPEEMLKGLPKVFMNVCQKDVLRDDGLWFAERLRKLNVPLELDFAECFHAWALYTEDLESASEAMTRMTDYINKNL